MEALNRIALSGEGTLIGGQGPFQVAMAHPDAAKKCVGIGHYRAVGQPALLDQLGRTPPQPLGGVVVATVVGDEAQQRQRADQVVRTGTATAMARASSAAACASEVRLDRYRA